MNISYENEGKGLSKIIQTYQGYFNNKGDFVDIDNHEIKQLPKNLRLIINVIDEPINDQKEKEKHSNRIDSWEHFFRTIDSIEGEDITDEDIAYLEKNRINFKRNLGEI